MGPLGHDPRNERNVELVEAMGAALDRDGFNARVGEDDLVEVFRGGITFVGGFNIGYGEGDEVREGR